jgi:precorrin-6B methylase 2
MAPCILGRGFLTFMLLVVLGAPPDSPAPGDEGKPRKTGRSAKVGKEEPKDEKNRDVPFVPTPQDVVEKMLALAKVQKTDLLYDLGCGDGRIVITAAKDFGCKAIGVEIDPRCIKQAKQTARIERVDNLVTIKKQDLFTVDLTDADVVALYLHPDLNAKLIPQLEKMKPGSRIVSHQYDMPGVKPTRTVRVLCKDGFERTIYLWVTPLKK